MTFDDYAIDLSQFARKAKRSRGRANGRRLQLIAPDPDASAPRLAARLRAELLDRLVSPFYAFAAGLIGFAALGEARTTRQGRGVATAIAIVTFSALRMLGIATISLAVSRPYFALFVWAIPIRALGDQRRRDLRPAFGPRLWGDAPPRRRRDEDAMIGGTLGRYFAWRFFKTVVAVFAGVFALIYAVDLVEMLRRGSDTPAATGAC